jgi:hypothetical protein
MEPHAADGSSTAPDGTTEGAPEGLALGNPAPLNVANGMLEMEPAHTVALALKATGSGPMSFGAIETALMAEGRAQHRIWRVEVGAHGAVARVHPADVERCVGVLQSNGEEVRPQPMPANADLARASRLAQPSVRATIAARLHPPHAPAAARAALVAATSSPCPQHSSRPKI